MATRYWGGGSGTWDSNTATNWYSDAGRTILAAAPTYADSVIFDSASNATLYTVTMANGFVGAGSISGTVLTITAVTSGALAVGNSIYAQSAPTGTNYIAGGTYITSLGTGSGGIGTYNLNISQTATSTTMYSGPSCLDITIVGPASGAVTLAGAAVTCWSIYGSMTLPATGLTWTATPIIVFCSTTTGKTITTNGVTILGATTSFVAFDGVGGGWTLGSALTLSINNQQSLRVIRGTFDTNASPSYNITLTSGAFYSSGTNTRVINLNSSTITSTNSATGADFTITTGLTFNAGTSTFSIAANSAGLNGGGLTFYNVNYTNTGFNGLPTISGANTFNNLTFATSPNGIRGIIFAANQTVNGTLTFGSSNTAISRFFVKSDIIGTQRTITLNGTLATLSDVDFADIKAAGSATLPWTGTRLGNCHGNDETTITFPAGVNKYWNLAAGGNWNATAWATSSGGTPAVNNFPLAQDTVIIDDTSPNVSSTITVNVQYNIGTLNFSARATALTFTNTTNAFTVYGDITLSSAVTTTGTGTLTFAGQKATQNITSAGRTWTQPLTVNTNTATGVTLVDAMTLGSTLTFTLTQGILNLNNNVLSTGLFASNNSNTRTLAFGTGNITATGTGTVFTTATVTGLTVTGTPVVNVTNAGSTAISVAVGGATEANAISFNFIAGTYSLTFLNNVGYTAKNVNFTGFSGTWATTGTTNTTIYGNLTISPTMTITRDALAYTLIFGATSTGKTITTNGKTIDFGITFNGVGGSWILQDDFTIGSTRTLTLTNGTLNLNNKTLTAGLFSSTNSNTRTIAFGTSSINVTGTGTVWNTTTMTGLSVTGTPLVNITNTGSTAINIGQGSGATEALSFSFNITGGTYAFTTTGAQNLMSLNFTGFSGTWTPVNMWIYGNLILSPTMSVASTTLGVAFKSTSTGKTITTAGKTLDFPVTFDGVGGSWILQDDFTIGSTRTLTLTNGTLDLNGKTLNSGTSFTTAAGTKNITFNSGTIVCPAATTTAFNNAVPTGFTTTAGSAAGIISMTGATAKTFVGGGSTYAAKLKQDGLGTLTISGSNTFTDIQNTVQPTTITFTSGTTTTFTSGFSLAGTAGNLVTLNATTPGSAATMSKSSGVISAAYLSIRDSTATGGANWLAQTTSTLVSNTLGWIVSNGTAVVFIGSGITVGQGITFS